MWALFHHSRTPGGQRDIFSACWWCYRKHWLSFSSFYQHFNQRVKLSLSETASISETVVTLADLPSVPTLSPTASTTKSADFPTTPPSSPGPQARTFCWPASGPTLTSIGLKNKQRVIKQVDKFKQSSWVVPVCVCVCTCGGCAVRPRWWWCCMFLVWWGNTQIRTLHPPDLSSCTVLRDPLRRQPFTLQY